MSLLESLITKFQKLMLSLFIPRLVISEFVVFLNRHHVADRVSAGDKSGHQGLSAVSDHHFVSLVSDGFYAKARSGLIPR